MTASNERLIVFTRFPKSGQVKTRLISALGADVAAGLHRQLTLRTLRTASAVAEQRGLTFEIHFEGGSESAMRHWLGDNFALRAQSDGTLGERMAFSFNESFRAGAAAVIIIGSDCPELSAETLNRAFDKLSQHRVVLGPATDGGYYLVGLRQMIPELFRDMAWGSATVLRESLRVLEKAKVQPELLEELADIDVPNDLSLWDRIAQAEDDASLSVIIPTLNEAENITATLNAAREGRVREIIVVDGGSTDGTVSLAHQAGAMVLSSTGGRARQMNMGAARAGSSLLLFVHADTLLAPGYANAAIAALRDPTVIAGAFGFQIDQSIRGQSLLERATNARSRLFQLPYGDQGLFIKRSSFEQLGGFADLPVMEDYEFVRRLRRRGRVVTLALPARTSGRRWGRLGVLRTTLINTLMVLGYHARISPARLATFYRSALSRSKGRH